MRQKILLLSGVVVVLLVVLVVAAGLVVRGLRLSKTEVTPGPVSPQAGTYLATIDHGGRVRRYLLHVPPAAKDLQPLPLVVLLHGGGGPGDRIDDLTGMIAIADREGFLVALPDGVDKNWNDGRDDVRSTAHRENVDDVGFIRAMIDDVAAKTPVEARRVYAAGISNGAMMSSRLACEASDLIAAVGLVVGTAPEGFEETCRPLLPRSRSCPTSRLPITAGLSARPSMAAAKAPTSSFTGSMAAAIPGPAASSISRPGSWGR